MPTYVAFLRAINLGATRKFPKPAIVAATEAAGGTDVQTWINTGNVRLTTSLRSRTAVERALEEAYAAATGFGVPTIAFTPRELRRLVEDADEIAADFPHPGRHYVSLLKEEPDADVVAVAEASTTDTERFAVRGRGAHLLLAEDEGYQRTRLSNTWVEKRLGVATNRNLTVVRAVVERWC